MNQQNPSNAAARDAAERALAEYRAGAAGVIEYRSRGRVLVIGQGDVIDGAAFMLPPPLSARVRLPLAASIDRVSRRPDVRMFRDGSGSVGGCGCSASD